MQTGGIALAKFWGLGKESCGMEMVSRNWNSLSKTKQNKTKNLPSAYDSLYATETK